MKKLIKAIAAAAAGVTLAMTASACNKAPTLKENIIDDAYDNYYEIFVYSFCDSDGNRVGDFNGVTQKLDYIRDMGYTGIWLMPISPSPSYHKYDVTDYKAVDPIYGTMEDFDGLLSAAHDKGIKVILDLVVNHTSKEHEWFKQASGAYVRGETDNKYYDYYNFTDEKQNGYAPFAGVYYEARFDANMPDLNLDNPKVRGEISEVIEFWMKKGVDGFRLDACTSYYTNSKQKSVEFAGWIKEEAVKHNPDAYIVGEVWSDAGTINDFYGSGADSFFCFPAQGANGYVGSAISTSLNFGSYAAAANSYYSSMETVVSMANGYIPAPFLCNHDTGRAAGFLSRDARRVKFAYGLLSLYTGNTFTYYGDEIGMTGSANDPDKRVGMRWTKDTKGIYPPGVTSHDESKFYVFDSVEDQLKDENSILNYYKLCNNLRNAFPAIMRGTTERVAQPNENVLVIKKTYEGQTVTIAVNFANEESVVEGSFGKLQQSLCVEGKVSAKGSSVTMPALSIAVFA